MAELDFTGRVALITGAGAGIGRAYALWLATRGAAVVVNNRRRKDVPSSADATVEAIRSAGGTAVADYNPIETEEGSSAMVATAVANYGKLDILIANAGGNQKKPILETSIDHFRHEMDVNYWGTALPVLAALPGMIERDYGRVILTTSAAGLFGQKQHAPYAAGKMAVVGFGRALAIEMAKLDIRINMVSPYARTTGSAHVLGGEMAEVMSPEHIAPVVGWLAHQSCDKTGMILSAGAGRVRRTAVVEGDIVEIGGRPMADVWNDLAELGTITESRNSGRSAIQLVPELAALVGAY
jgi:NAD(P)-dependent dehydrogenase (short-subunit alcohol dehydrogenase family)